MGHKDHPVYALEKWRRREELRGVAGGKTVPLIGAVVLTLEATKLGTKKGPKIKARFKICAKGTTDWIGIILGARALDCPERGGLGFIPGPYGHTFTKLGIQV